jgi:hypothetical protein
MRFGLLLLTGIAVPAILSSATNTDIMPLLRAAYPADSRASGSGDLSSCRFGLRPLFLS